MSLAGNFAQPAVSDETITMRRGVGLDDLFARALRVCVNIKDEYGLVESWFVCRSSLCPVEGLISTLTWYTPASRVTIFNHPREFAHSEIAMIDL